MRNMWMHCQKQYRSTTTDMQCCMVSTCLSCYWQDLMDWCWHEPTRSEHAQFLCCWSQSFSCQQLQQLMFSACFYSRLVDSLYHSHPVIKHFRFHRTLATLGFQRPLHPANRFHCFQETVESLPPLAPFSATATAGVVPWLLWASKIPTLQDLEASRQDSCDHYASWNNVWLQRNQRNFIKKGITNHCIHQFQSLSIAIPETHELGTFQEKKGQNSHQPFTSHHSIPPQPWHHTKEATPCTESSRLLGCQSLRAPRCSWHPRQRGGCSWRPKNKLVIILCWIMKTIEYPILYPISLIVVMMVMKFKQCEKKDYEWSWSTYPIPVPDIFQSQVLTPNAC